MISATSNYLAALAAYRGGRLYYAIEIETYSRILTTQSDGISGHYPWIETGGIDDYSYTVNDLDGGADQGQLTFRVSDVGGAITGDFPSIVFEGKKIVVKQGFRGLAYSDYVELFTGYVTQVDSQNNNLTYKFTCSDVSSKLAKVVYTSGDDGYQTSGDHLRTVTGHPIDILFDIIENEVGMSSSDVDHTKLEAYRDGPFSGMKFVFHLDQAPTALDFLKNQILKPLGGYLWITAAGKVTASFSYPLDTLSPAGSLGPDTWTSIPTAEQLQLVNTTQFKFDKSVGSSSSSSNSDYLAISTNEYGVSVSAFGLESEHTVESDGLRSAFQGFFISQFVSRLIFLRYGLKPLKFDSDAADCIWGSILYEPGDIVSVTHNQVPDRQAGVMGITNHLFEIFNKSIRFTEGLVQYTMLDASYLSDNFGHFLIAPDGEADYTAASSPDKAKYMFLTDDTDTYSNSDAGHGLG